MQAGMDFKYNCNKFISREHLKCNCKSGGYFHCNVVRLDGI
ncbi:hypothetical protein Leryth_018986 [Lithospermum erythrorhizon]|nr:hypothetical protein Leryth_018986 [Lithospermum erythrorhizon]